jgi:hypothetical protein
MVVLGLVPNAMTHIFGRWCSLIRGVPLVIWQALSTVPIVTQCPRTAHTRGAVDQYHNCLGEFSYRY